jgi:hypothetical protein
MGRAEGEPLALGWDRRLETRCGVPASEQLLRDPLRRVGFRQKRADLVGELAVLAEYLGRPVMGSLLLDLLRDVLASGPRRP